MTDETRPRAVHEAAVLLAPAPLADDLAAAEPALEPVPVAGAPRAARQAEYRPTIREMAAGDRPRERLRTYGETALANAELLAIILRTGITGENVLDVAQRLLSGAGGLTGLARVSFDELCAMRGLGEAKASQLRAALELGRRLAASGPEERPVIRSSQDVARLVQSEMALLEQEQLRTLILNTKNAVLAIRTISSGTVNQSQVRPAEVFRPAIQMNATGIIIVHNHPSGDPTPSREDIAITRDLVDAGHLLDVEVLDHIVIGQGRFVSLKDRGLGF